MGFNQEAVQMREEGSRLTTLLERYSKMYSPYLDKQICLAHVINVLTESGFKITRSEIFYAFKRNYCKSEHGDVRSYVNWLFSLTQKAQVLKKMANNSFSEPKEALKSTISAKNEKEVYLYAGAGK